VAWPDTAKSRRPIVVLVYLLFLYSNVYFSTVLVNRNMQQTMPTNTYWHHRVGGSKNLAAVLPLICPFPFPSVFSSSYSHSLFPLPLSFIISLLLSFLLGTQTSGGSSYGRTGQPPPTDQNLGLVMVGQLRHEGKFSLKSLTFGHFL